MSTTPETAPPSAPPAVPTGGGGDGGGEPIGVVQVSRNVPPKRVVVNQGASVVFGGEPYNPGDTLLLAGPEADALALQGQVIITSHEEIAAWNGKEGEEQRKQALAHIDKQHAAEGTERTHDHGLGRYQHADGEKAIPVDLTSHRQQLAREHQYDPGKPDTMSDDQAGITQPGNDAGKGES